MCRQDAGVAVIFKCREANDILNRCVAERAGDDAAWQAFRAARIAEVAPALLAQRAAALEAKLANLRSAEAPQR